MADIVAFAGLLFSLLTLIVGEDDLNLNTDQNYQLSALHASYLLLNEPIGNFSCDDAMHEFASKLSIFSSCSAANARPITVCLQCAESFQNVTKAYNSISTNSDNSHGNCNDYLLDADRVQVLRFMYNAIASLWASLDCDYCFNQNPDNNTLGYQISEDTKTFNGYVNEAIECMRLNSNNATGNCSSQDSCTESAVCKNCTAEYVRLNVFYNDIYARGDSLCMDLVDLMNTSRTLWSKRYLCVNRKNSTAYLFVVTTLVLLLPVAFYFSSWLQSDKQEQSVIPQKRLIQVPTRAALAQQQQQQQ